MKRVLLIASVLCVPIALHAAPANNLATPTPTAADALTVLSRTNAARAQDVLNVKDAPYLAQGDVASFTTSTAAAGSCALYVPGAGFTAAAAGKTFVLHGAGPSAAPLTGTIAAFTDATHVTLSACPTNALPWSGAWAATVATPQSGAGSYAIGDTLTMAGGTGVVTAPSFTVASLQAASAAVAAGGSGGTAGACTVTGTTGAGTLFQASGTVASGALSGPLTIAAGGTYTTAPTNIAAEPVTGCGLTGATVSLTMGPYAVTSVAGGQFTSTSGNPVATTTSGSGTGATLTLTTYQVGGGFSYGTDDTAAVTNAIAAASVTGKTAYFPSGTYWLASQAAPIPLANVTLAGDGAIASGSTAANGGSTIWITDTATPAFTLGYGVNWRGLSANYPLQDNSQATPPAYPALFSSNQTTGAVNDIFQDFVFVNPYILFQTSGTGSAGRDYFRTGRAYCVSVCFNMLDGMPDTLVVDNDTYWSIGTDPNGNYGPKYLVNYTLANGTWFLANISGAYGTLDGMELHPHIVHQYRYGVRALAGVLNGMTLDVDAWDGTITPLSIENTASGLVDFTTRTWVYSTESTQLTNNPAINCTSTAGATRLVVSGTQFDYALGSFISNVTGNCFASLTVTGNTFHAWGESKTTGGYYAINLNASSAADVTITGNIFQVVGPVAGSVYHPIGVGNGGKSFTIAGNSFDGGYEAIWDNASTTGNVQVSGNSSTGTTGANALRITGAAMPIDDDNVWDKPPTKPVLSACGTSPSLSTNSSATRGQIVLGTGTVTSCTLTFPEPFAVAPTPQLTGSNPAVTVAVQSISTTALTIQLSASSPGASVFYRLTY